MSIEHISIDIEADGPHPLRYSMIQIGAVNCDTGEEFMSYLRPVSLCYLDSALKVSGVTREQSMNFKPPEEGMKAFDRWLSKTPSRKVAVVDNAFDWMFTCSYLAEYGESSALGYSCLNLNSLYKGIKKNLRSNIRKIKTKQKHTHDALDDARRNAEIFNMLREEIS